MQILPILLKDGYKVGHIFQYPKGTTKVFSNFTPRGSRLDGVDYCIPFGHQYFVTDFLIDRFTTDFFEQPKDKVLRAYKRRIDNYLGPDSITIDHIAPLHELGYVPLHIKALPEGTKVPLRVPTLTLVNTVDEFFWVTNMIESIMSAYLWKPYVAATIAFSYRKRFEEFAAKTGAPREFVKWQGHDFSFRGLSGIDDICKVGAAHLLSFTGSDTIPAIDFLEQYYFADCEKELIAGSVPATEHSVMCMGSKDGEIKTIKRLITEVYPKGIVSIVSDTWDFWQVMTKFLPALKEEILARDGKLVVRPDSGDPVKIICGDPSPGVSPEAAAGAIRLLDWTFGHTLTEKGYKVLNPKVGLIYGDSITPQRQQEILERLAANGYASSNVVLGIGSYTYQYVTRDSLGMAMKATYGEIDGVPVNISKDPKTDDGVKKSASGLLRVDHIDGALRLKENCTPEEESGGLLETIFLDGEGRNFESLADIRARIEGYL